MVVRRPWSGLVPGPGPVLFGARTGPFAGLREAVLADSARSTSVRVRREDRSYGRAPLRGPGRPRDVTRGCAWSSSGPRCPFSAAVPASSRELSPRFGLPARPRGFGVARAATPRGRGEPLRVRARRGRGGARRDRVRRRPAFARDAAWSGDAPRLRGRASRPRAPSPSSTTCPELLRDSASPGTRPRRASSSIARGDPRAGHLRCPTSPRATSSSTSSATRISTGARPAACMHATRPGHARNHAAFRRALDEGILRWSFPRGPFAARTKPCDVSLRHSS